MQDNSTLNASADRAGARTPITSTFSRPAAIAGGAIGLVILTAAATALMVRSPGSKDGADSRGTSAVALVGDASKTRSSGTVLPQAPADFPEKMEPKADAKADPAEAAAPKRAPVQASKGSVNTAAGAKASPAAPARAVASACTTCGVVEAVTPVKKKGEATGVGAVGGAVVGGLLGNAMGGGDGRKAMTVIGAVGGGVAGNAIEKNARATTQYQVTVRMEDGTVRTLTQSSAPAVGQKVTVEGSSLKNRA